MKKSDIQKNGLAGQQNQHLSVATVCHIMHKQAQMLLEDQTVPCMLPSSMISGRNTLGVGDQVEIERIGNEQYKLVTILPRKSALYRGNRRAEGEEILIAANAELLLTIATAEYLRNQTGYLEASLIAAKRAGIKAGVFVSKWDLMGEQAQSLLQKRLELYRQTADFLFVGSTLEPPAALLQLLKGKTTVVVGDRSCGKTSLIQGLFGQLEGESSGRKSLQGTHCCTLQAGPGHTFLIDTPGFRDFALYRVSEEERRAVFPEIARFMDGCHFHNCTHLHEEGCRVLQALRDKQITRERYDAYRRMSADKSEAAPANPDYRRTACTESFVCKVCGNLVVPEGAGSRHRNHCPKCLSSVHVDEEPGDRASVCNGVMEPVSVWVRKDGEWAVIHRCRLCGKLSSNRIAADDNPALLLSIAVRPLAMTPFPLNQLEAMFQPF